MASLKDLYEHTLVITTNINSVSFERIEELIELREEVIALLSRSGPLTEEEKACIIQISQFDELLTGRMEVLRDEASVGLTKIDNNRKQRSSYDASLNSGSYFIDIRN